MSPNAIIKLANFEIGNDKPLTLIAGPCAMESRDHAFFMANELKEITSRLGINFIYKSSFDKANRSSRNSQRGIGIETALPIFEAIRKEFDVPVITDVHTEEQCAIAGEIVDVLQIPAFLCRQTDLLEAAAATGKIVNVKKGQFLAPWDMKHVVAKVVEAGNIELGTDMVIAAVLSCVTAFGAIAVFMKMLESMSMMPFVIYRVVLGLGLLAWVYWS